MSVGGEFSGSVTYMVETSPLHKRGLSGSWANFGSMAGTLLGSGLAALVTTVLAESQVDAWGWRLPFVLGGVFGLIAYGFVRKVATHPHMDHHEAQHENDSPLREALTRNRRETILAVVFASGYGILFYLPLVYLPTFATEVGNINNALALQINAAGLAIAMPLIPLSGWISDHWLRRRSLLLLAFGLLVVTSVGVFLLAQGGAGSLALAQIGSAALLAVPLGAAPAMLVELFPVADRLTGYSLAYNVGLGVAGGSAPMIATWLISQTGQDLAPAYYMAFAALLSAAGLYLMKDRSREALR
jgi:MHS family proline/betaine transporter-like MFS transporter